MWAEGGILEEIAKHLLSMLMKCFSQNQSHTSDSQPYSTLPAALLVVFFSLPS